MQFLMVQHHLQLRVNNSQRTGFLLEHRCRQSSPILILKPDTGFGPQLPMSGGLVLQSPISHLFRWKQLLLHPLPNTQLTEKITIHLAYQKAMQRVCVYKYRSVMARFKCLLFTVMLSRCTLEVTLVLLSIHCANNLGVS